jgi:hypothetical protein
MDLLSPNLIVASIGYLFGTALILVAVMYISTKAKFDFDLNWSLKFKLNTSKPDKTPDP